MFAHTFDMSDEIANKLLRLAKLKTDAKRLEADLEDEGVISPCSTPPPFIQNSHVYAMISKYHTDMVSIHSMNGDYEFVTDSCSQFGWSPTDLIGQNAYKFFCPEDVDSLAENHSKHIRFKDEVSEISYRMLCKDGTYRWVQTKSQAHRNGSGIEKLVCVTRDIHEMKKMEFELLEANSMLRELVTIDELTRIPNFRAYRSKIEEFMYEYTRGTDFALVVIDIDHFKRINDTYGHETGNCVLQGIAEMLMKQTRQSDFICRFGGEEFILLLKGTTEDVAVNICESFREKIEKTEICDIHVTASFGLAIYDDKLFKTSEELVRAADTAMYQSKKNGRNKVTLFTPGMVK